MARPSIRNGHNQYETLSFQSTKDNSRIFKFLLQKSKMFHKATIPYLYIGFLLLVIGGCRHAHKDPIENSGDNNRGPTSADVDVSVSVQPNPLIEGESAQYTLTSSSGKLQLVSFPDIDGILWQDDSSSSVQYRNFIPTYSVAYSFKTTNAGDFRIPATQIQIDDRSVPVDPINFVVRRRPHAKSNEDPVLSDLIFLELMFNGHTESPERVSVGEEIVLNIKLSVDRRLQIYMNRFDSQRNFASPSNYFPTLNLENVIYKDYTKQNPHNGKFLFEDQTSEIRNDHRFDVFRYRASVSGVKTGVIMGTIEHTLPLVAANGEQPTLGEIESDDPLGILPSRQVVFHDIRVTVEPISVESTPENYRD